MRTDDNLSKKLLTKIQPILLLIILNDHAIFFFLMPFNAIYLEEKES